MKVNYSSENAEKKLKKQGIKSFANQWVLIQMLRKKRTQSKKQFLLRYPVNRQEVRKLESLMKNQINLIAHLYFQKLLLLKKTDRLRHSSL